MAEDKKQKAAANPLIEALSGALRGLTTDTVGAPVDLINMALKAFGAPTAEAPVGGSKWMRKLLDQPQEDSGAATAGNLASALASPGKAAVDMAQMLPALAGIFIGPKSKLWDKDAAEYLEAMTKYLDELPAADKKAAEAQIFQELNVFRSPGDKKLRQEIPDNNARTAPGIEGMKGRAWLADVLDHEELYKAYPQFKKMPVNARPSAETDSNASFMNGTLFTDPLITFNPNSKSATTDLLHEIQHAIQAKEGFARGGSAEAMRNTQEFQQLKAQHNLVNDNALARALYARLAGEAESRAVEARAFASPDILREAFPLESYDIKPENLLVKFYGQK